MTKLIKGTVTGNILMFYSTANEKSRNYRGLPVALLLVSTRRHTPHQTENGPADRDNISEGKCKK